MNHYDLVLVGFGNVGRAFVRLLQRKQNDLQSSCGLSFSITGIATSRHGMAINPLGLDLNQALTISEQGGSLSSLTTCPLPSTILEFIRTCPGQVFFENSPVNHQTGQPAIDHLSAALEMGMHCVTANKGPVVHGYQALTTLAAAHKRRFMFESAVMDGAPIFSLFREPLPAANLLGLKGILNSCTNLLLTRMEQGATFDQAVDYARSIGITETDPQRRY